MAPLPEAPPDEPAATFDGLQNAPSRPPPTPPRPAPTSPLLVLDRNTGQIVSNGNDDGIAIASVAKLFIADDLLLQESKGQTQLSARRPQGTSM